MPAVGSIWPSILWQAVDWPSPLQVEVECTPTVAAISVVTPGSRFYSFTSKASLHFTQFGVCRRQLFAPKTDKPLTHNVALSRLVTSCRRLS
jgi:hypothetical protein